MRRRVCRPPSLLDALPVPARHADGAAVLAPDPVGSPWGGPAGVTAARRILALHLPWLATERLRLAGTPAACWTTEGSRRLLSAVSPEAAAAGLHPGQALADAQAILPGLDLHPADPAADAAWLRRLALWALCVTPLPAVDPPQGLVLDVTGIAHLHGDEAALLAAVTARFARAGVTIRAALAGSPATAAALARAGLHGALVPPGEERAAVEPLPLAALGLPLATIGALHRLGLRCIGDVLRQPRGPLARRFGAALVDALDAAAGARPQPITPLRPPPEFLAERTFLEPILTREAIDATLDRLLAALCRQLAEAGRGARRLVLLAFRVDGEVQGIAVGTGLPARDPRHFTRLFREKLERLAPGFGFERLALEARVTEPIGAEGAQASLPGRGGLSPEARRQALAQLLDRLSQRMPVWRLAPRPSHWPERAVQRLGPFDPVPPPGTLSPGPPVEGSWPHRPRPVRLLRRPVPLSAMALLPDAPPSLLRAGTRVAWRVVRAEGPERIAPEWWRDGDRPIRDYYRVELEGGARLWVCRSGLAIPGEEMRWWLHGRFA
jgi:protein ImuB